MTSNERGEQVHRITLGLSYDITCGACTRSYLHDHGIGCISLLSTLGEFLLGYDPHDSTCTIAQLPTPSAWMAL